MGAIFNQGVPYSGGGVLNVITKNWAQYQALSSAEKHDASKYYFVPDAPAQGVPGIIQKLKDNITDAYDPESSYNVGDLCIYNNKLYICNTDNTTGDWDSEKWTARTIEQLINTVESKIPSVIDSLTGNSTTDALSAAKGASLYAGLYYKFHPLYVSNGASAIAKGATLVSAANGAPYDYVLLAINYSTSVNRTCAYHTHLIKKGYGGFMTDGTNARVVVFNSNGSITVSDVVGSTSSFVPILIVGIKQDYGV